MTAVSSASQILGRQCFHGFHGRFALRWSNGRVEGFGPFAFSGHHGGVHCLRLWPAPMQLQYSGHVGKGLAPQAPGLPDFPPIPRERLLRGTLNLWFVRACACACACVCERGGGGGGGGVNCAYPLGREVADVGSRTASNWLAVAAIMTQWLCSGCCD